MKANRTMGIALSIALLASGMAFGQTGQAAAKAAQTDRLTIEEARRDFQRLELTREEFAGLREIVGKELRAVEQERARIREAQARLARLMLENKPDMDAIRATVRDSLEAEFRIRIVQIERNIAIRTSIGDARWAALSRLSRTLEALSKSGRLDELRRMLRSRAKARRAALAITEPHEESVAVSAERRAAAEAVLLLLDALPEPDRSLLYLRDAEGIDVKSLAYAFGLAEGTIKSKLAGARLRVRDKALRAWGDR